MQSNLFRFPHLLLVLGLVLFTGCLTIEENYSFKKNGSGTMEYVVDLSEMGGLMESFGEMGEGGSKDLGVMEMSEQVQTLKSIPGIRKVKLNNKKKWIQRVSFSFKDVAALNSALNVLMPDSTNAQHEFFRWDGATLVRTNNRHAHDLGASLAKTDENEGADGEESAMKMTDILASMKYKYSFKFADGIAANTAAEGVNKETVSRKAMRFDTDFSVIGRDPKALDLTIQLDR